MLSLFLQLSHMYEIAANLLIIGGSYYMSQPTPPAPAVDEKEPEVEKPPYSMRCHLFD